MCLFKLQRRLSKSFDDPSAYLRPLLVHGSPQQLWWEESDELWSPESLLKLSQGEAGSEYVVLASQRVSETNSFTYHHNEARSTRLS